MERNGVEYPVLIGQTGPLNGERWAVKQTLLLGRDTSCDVVIPDRQVSRFHARLLQSQDRVILEDLGSKNGTFHNSQRIEEPVALQDGDVIQISLIQYFVFLSSDATVPLDGGTAGGFAAGTGERSARISLDKRSRRVWVGQQELLPPLSVPQFRLLQILYEQPDKVVSRQDLISAIWSDEDAEGVSEQALDALVRRLRERLAQLDPQHEYILTIRGHGLRLDNE
ncbi:MAG TPA: FHA domain-containing protein [Anaerolineaceae bacterium]|nr:FHA domain-containing protein [Anaerolineaceae bacterium]